MSAIALEVEKRDESLNPRQLRAQGMLPATVYGKGMESVSIQVNERNFVNLYKNNKEATFELKSNDAKYNAVVQNFQVQASNQQAMNIEFKTV